MRALLPLLLLGVAIAPPLAQAAWRAVAEGELVEGLHHPSAVLPLEEGRILVLDGGAGEIAVFGPSGERRGTLRPAATPLIGAMDLVLAGGRLVVSDPLRHRLVLLDLQGAPQGEIPLPAGDHPAEPTGLAWDGVELHWSDRRNHRICHTRLDDGRTLTCHGGYGTAGGRFRYPFLIAVDEAGYLHVADVLNARIQILDRRGHLFGRVGGFGLAPGRFVRPNGIALGGDGLLVAGDALTGTLSLFRHRRFVGRLEAAGGHPLGLEMPVGLALRGERLFVVEAAAARVRIFRLRGEDASAPGGGRERPSDSTRRRECLSCHLSWSPEWREEEEIPPPVARPRMCLSCHHGAVVDSRRRLTEGAQHPDLHHPRADEAPFETAERRRPPLPGEMPFYDGTPYCGTCHTPHRPEGEEQPPPGETRNRWMRGDHRQGDFCTLCHEDHRSEDGPRGRNHPIGIRLAPPPAPGARRYPEDPDLQKGVPERLRAAGSTTAPEEAVTCATCHRAHGGETAQLLLPPTELCATCHRRQESADKKAARRRGIHPVHEKLEEPVELAGRSIERVECLTCHDVHGGEAETPLLGRPAGDRFCAACHEGHYTAKKEEARRKGVHPVGVELEEPVRLAEREVHRVGCATCHAVHDGRPDTASLVLPTDRLCRGCHDRQHAADGDEARRKGVHPIGVELEEPVEIGGRRIGKIDCLTCHSIHRGRPETPALVESHRDGRLCDHCHEGTARMAGSDHDLRQTAPESRNALKQPPREAGLCGTCHSLHRAGEKSDRLLLVPREADPAPTADDPRDRPCLACHRQGGEAEEKPVPLHDHPWRDLHMVTREEGLPLLDGEGDSILRGGRIGCITCHDPHRWRPGSPPDGEAPPATGGNREGTALDSFLRTLQPEGTFCADCHGIESRLRFKYYHHERSRPGRAPQMR